jgi:C1A family cysteine protease
MASARNDKRKVKHYGVRRDDDDDRDQHFDEAPGPYTHLREVAKFREPPAWQQLPLLSCTAHAVAAALWYVQARDRKQGPPVEPSRLFLHYHSVLLQQQRIGQSLEATSDGGVSLRNGLKAARRYGACAEFLWPHPALPVTSWRDPGKVEEEAGSWRDATTFQAMRGAPDEKLYFCVELDGVKAKSYRRVKAPDASRLRAAISRGSPVVFAVKLYSSVLAAARRGRVPIPAPREEEVGEHSLVAVGFNDKKRTITARSSWGPLWGDDGHAHFPYAYFDEKRTLDAWVLDEVERLGE